ncbi:MAG: hypothetical protein ACREXS_18010 [Gammaproteobacteria bacterium]
MKTDDTDRMQGEGDRKSARKYNEATRRFVKSGKAKHPRKTTNLSQADLEHAEETGRKHAKKEDPSVHRDHKKPNR